MRRATIFCAVACCLSAAHAAPHALPVKSPEATSLSIKTASDLADACTLTPNSKASFARLTFCSGFAQGVLQTSTQGPNGLKAPLIFLPLNQ